MTTAEQIINDLMTAFNKFCEDRQKPEINQEVRNYIIHCISKAMQRRGEDATIMDHQTFAVMALDQSPELVMEFLKALDPKQEPT